MLRKPGSSKTSSSSSSSRRRNVSKEQPDDIVRKISRSTGNKKCADCSGKMPQAANLTHGTFVCLTCAGIHREFSHRIKGIGHSSFSQDEATFLSNNGNEAVNTMYMANYERLGERLRAPNAALGPVDQQLLRVWIRRKYTDKAWYSSSGGDSNGSSSAANDTANTNGSSSNSNSFQSHATMVTIPPKTKKSVAVAAPVPAQAPAPAPVDLFGSMWDESNGNSNSNANANTAPVTVTATPATTNNVNDDAAWDAFGQSRSSTSGANDPFASPAPVPNQQQQSNFAANFPQMQTNAPPPPASAPSPVPQQDPFSTNITSSQQGQMPMPMRSPMPSQTPMQQQQPNSNANFPQQGQQQQQQQQMMMMNSTQQQQQQQQMMMMSQQSNFQPNNFQQQQAGFSPNSQQPPAAVPQMSPPQPPQQMQQQQMPTQQQQMQMMQQQSMMGMNSPGFNGAFPQQNQSHIGTTMQPTSPPELPPQPPQMSPPQPPQMQVNGSGNPNFQQQQMQQMQPNMMGMQQPTLQSNNNTMMSTSSFGIPSPTNNASSQQVQPASSQNIGSEVDQSTNANALMGGTGSPEEVKQSSSMLNGMTNANDAFDAFSSLSIMPNSDKSTSSNGAATKESESMQQQQQQAPAAGPKYSVGKKLVYKDSQGNTSDAEIVKVHLDDDLVPFYDIKLPDGREKQTDNSHLFEQDQPQPLDVNTQHVNGSAKTLPSPVSIPAAVAPVVVDPSEKLKVVVGMMNGLSYEQLERVEQFITSITN